MVDGDAEGGVGRMHQADLCRRGTTALSYPPTLLDVGVETGLSQTGLEVVMFIDQGGVYSWDLFR